jgi:hypothetical protein
MANSDEFKNQLERRLGTEEYERIGKRGQDRPNDRGQYDAAEVISEFRNRSKGTKVDEGEGSMVDYFQGLVNDGAKFNNRAKDYLTKQGINFGGGGGGGGDDEPGPGNDVPAPTPVPSPTPTPGPSPTPVTPGPSAPPPLFGNSQTQNINQDNDITTSITGDNNTVNNNQDNSISQSMGSSDYASRYARGMKDQYVLNLMNR